MHSYDLVSGTALKSGAEILCWSISVQLSTLIHLISSYKLRPWITSSRIVEWRTVCLLATMDCLVSKVLLYLMFINCWIDIAWGSTHACLSIQRLLQLVSRLIIVVLVTSSRFDDLVRTLFNIRTRIVLLMRSRNSLICWNELRILSCSNGSTSMLWTIYTNILHTISRWPSLLMCFWRSHSVSAFDLAVIFLLLRDIAWCFQILWHDVI